MPHDFTVVALISAYNEVDVIACVVGDLIAQGVGVYLLDDRSTDGTAEAVESLVGHGVLKVERTEPGEDGAFCWGRILARKQALAGALEADWFIHADADEFRESPWPGVNLREGIHRVDRQGYNAIDFSVLEFHPTDEGFLAGQDPREALRAYRPGLACDRLQIKCWKKTGGRVDLGGVDLVSSGGHEARFAGRRVFPVRFLLRHYPFRSQAHGERKLFGERRPRYRAEERAAGWHVHYDGLASGHSFVRPAEELTLFDAKDVRLTLAYERVAEIAQESESERARLTAERDALAHERDALAHERDALTRERDALTRERDALTRERDALAHEVSTLRQVLVEVCEHREGLRGWLEDMHASYSWRLTAPLRWVSAPILARARRGR